MTCNRCTAPVPDQAVLCNDCACPDCVGDPLDYTLHREDCRRVDKPVEIQCGPPWNPWPES